MTPQPNMAKSTPVDPAPVAPPPDGHPPADGDADSERIRPAATHDPYCAEPWHGLPCICSGAVMHREVLQQLVDAAQLSLEEHIDAPGMLEAAMAAAAELGVTPVEQP